MEISECKIGQVSVIRVKGQADVDGHPEKLPQVVHQHLEAGEREFICNLADCTYMDSTGLGELVRSFVEVTDKKGVVKLACVPRRLRDTFTITRLIDVVEIYESEQAALASFGH